MKCAWEELLGILPLWLRAEVNRQGRDSLQEIRLRRGNPVMLINGKERLALHRLTEEEDMQFVINAACRYSPWTASTRAQGYITAPGGHRIGICGEALVRNGQMQGVGTVTSLNIRIARDFTGISGNLWLCRERMLILGPPGSGKTTLLRDIIRKRSQRENISVVDERGEIFPLAANFQKGNHLDILSGCMKKEGILFVLKTMTPECIAVDEITSPEDCDALIHAGWCGVSLLATVHASSISDLYARSVYLPLVASGLFDTVVVMRKDKSWYLERIT